MEQIENLNEQQPKSNNKKKKTLLIILLLLLFVIIGLAIALPLVLIKDDKAEIVDLRLSKNTFTYGEAYLTTPVFVIYDDDSQKEITLLDTNLSQEDSAKFLIIGQHQITMTYDDFIKGETITVTEAEFTSQEIAALVYSDHVVEFTGEGYFFPVTNLPDGASVTYTIDEIVQNATSYSLIESGSYEVEATISKQNYRDYQLTFSVTIVDTSITIEGFNQEGDLFSTTVSSQTDSINFEEIVSVAGEGNFDIYSDGELENILDKSNISLTAGENTFYLKVYFDNNNIEHVYTITINKSSMLSVTYLLNGIELDKVFVEENGSISQPNYQKEGYIILGWQRNGEDITFPYLVTEDIVLNAVYTLENYDILLNLAEGMIEGDYKQSYTVEDESFTLPIPQREGYIFLGWSGTGLESPTLSVTIEQGSTGDREYTANWEIKKFTVTWENEDGSELEVDQNVEWGSMPSYDGETPTKESTAQYDYEFAGWSPEISVVSGDITYTATFTPVLRSYSVTFGEGVTVIVDGEPIISGQEIEYGKTLTISYTESEGYHKTSFKVNGQEQTSPYQHEVTSAVTIEYSEEINVYTVTLPSGTGYSIESDTTSVNHGSDFKFKVVLSEGYTESRITVKANVETLVLGDDGYYTITNVTESKTVTIEGVVLNTYTIIWNNWDGEELTRDEVTHGEMPSYSGDTPTREASAEFTYTFTGWDPKVAIASEDTSYTAQYKASIRSYQVTFNSNGGSDVDSITKEYGSKIGALPQPTKEGHTFEGWFTNLSGGEEINEGTLVTGDVTYYAHWSVNSHSINKIASQNGDFTITVVGDDLSNVDYGTTVTIAPQAEQGYTFIKAYYIIEGEEEEILITDNTFTMPDGNISIYVIFDAVDYTLEKGETSNGDFTLSVNGANVGTEITISLNPDPGYEFDRAYYLIDNAGEEIAITDNKFTMPAGNVTVYVVYKTIEYTITLDPGEGTLSGEDTLKYTVESEDITLEEPTREGYTFLGWSGTGLEEATKEVTIKKGSTGDREYTANWEIKKFTVTWENEDGSELEVDQNVEWGSMPSYDGETPTKESTAEFDYTFSGWSPEVVAATEDSTYIATFTETRRSYSVTFGENITVTVDNAPISTGDKVEYGKTLTISYTESEGHHKTSFKVNSEEKENNCTVTVTGEVVIEYSEEINVYTVTLPSGTGYSISSEGSTATHGGDFKFKVVLSEGYTESQITVKANDETLVLGDDGYYTITNVTESKTVTIEGVVLNTYTIIWNNWDGTELTRDEVTHGEMPSYSGDTPTKESTAEYDYTFLGWSPEVVVATEDATYTAEFTSVKRSYVVKFDSVEGSKVEDITKEYGSEIGALPQPTKEGHAFEGWFTDLSAGEEINEGTLVTGDVTYYAHWSVNNYSVTTSPATNGSISASPNADYGTEVTITVSEEEGYTLSNLYYNYDGNEDPISIDIKTTISTTYSFTMPAGNVTIHAEFAQIIDEWLFYEDMVMSYIGPDGDMATIPSSYSSRGNVEIKELKFETSQDYFDYVRNNSQELSKVMLQMIKLTIEDQVYENLTPYEYMKIMEQDDAFDSNNDPNTVINVTMEYVSYDNIIFYVGEETTVSEISSLTFLNTENQSYANIDHLNIPATIENIGDETFSEWGRSIYIFTIESADVYTGLISTESNVMGGLLGRAKIIRVPTTIVGSYENSYLNNETLYTKTTDNDYTVFTLKYTVTFNSNGGSDVDSIQVPYNTAIGELPVPTKEGYEFAGWFTDLSAGEKITEDTVITTNVTYYAQWNLINYNITLNLMGGGVSGEYKQTYTILDSNFDLPVPTKEGHEFLGWTGEGIEEPTITVTIVQGTTGDLEYTANWEINQYTYTFYRYEGGDILKKETVDYGSEIIAPTDVIRASDSINGINYTFLAWDKEVSTIGAGDIEFYATWSEENFSTNLNFVYSTLDGYYIVDKGSCQESEVIVPSSFTTLENGKADVCEVAANGFASTNMTSITFNGQITAIGDGAFANSSSLTMVSGLDHLYTIPANAFSGCSALTSFTIGESVIIVGSNAFSGAGLTSIYIPASVVSIENGAFEGCPIASFSVSEDNRNYASFEGNLYNKNLTELILYAAGQNASTFSVPNFVSAIGDYAFGNNNDLLNRSAASVGALQNIIIPTNVTSLKDFSLNNSLTVYTNFSSKPSTWSEASIANNTVYWQDEWQLVENEPTLTISPSAFKTGVYQNWMSYISDETLFVDVVMPGSHDAGTMSITAENLHTQSSGFYDQLTGGVRYFDMRVAEYNGTVRCIHANSNNDIDGKNGIGVPFQEVLDDINRFLEDNPYEVIILDFQHIWKDFESQVVPMIEASLSGKMLTKDKAANYLSLTMGQLRQWGVNIILVAQDDSKELNGATMPSFDQHNYMYKRTENLRSEYVPNKHTSSADDLIGIWPSYFDNFTEDQYNKIFVLQTQLTAESGSEVLGAEKNLVNREKSIRNEANKYFRGLKNNSTNLAKVNVIMRDFVVDDLSGVDSAQSSIQSVIFLNVYKNQIKETELERFKLLIDFDTVNSWATA